MLIGGQALPGSATRVESFVDASRAYFRIPGRTREEVLFEMASRLATLRLVPSAPDLVARLLEREQLGCTGLGGGIAIPHCKMPGISEVVVAMATTAEPIAFGAADGIPVRLIFLVASPAASSAAHLQALARISRILRTPGVIADLDAADSVERLLGIMRTAETRGTM
ncbi:MAG TPA: PTS sugar transporter subunit IIA [Thermoanaerobaculia bacterium]|jgi:mannitol/fructose-specific phosphotransferase system IIA component (Ntr-type)|nr:PTS sugar transporter subunit IIA [Thermoanaerobaculia bacterium]